MGVKIVKEGEGWEMADEDWTVRAKFTARCGGWKTDVLKGGWPTDSVTLTLGKISQRPGVTDGLEEAIKMMKKGETAQFEVRADYGYGEKGCADLNVDGKQTLYYEVNVLSCTKPNKTPSQMRGKDKLSYSQRKKEEGNQCFKSKRYRKACEKYHIVLKCYDYDKRESGTDDDEDSYPERVEPADILSLQTVCHSNLSMCYLRQKKYSTAIEHCDIILNKETTEKNNDTGIYTKLYFRRGQAWLYNSDPEKSLDDFAKAKSMTQDASLIAQIEKFENAAKKRIEKQRKKQKKAYAGFFNKKGDAEEVKGDGKDEDAKDVKDNGKDEKKTKDDGNQTKDEKETEDG